MTEIIIRPEDATTKQLLVAIFRQNERQELIMSRLSDSVDTLLAEVAVLADEIGSQVQTLRDQLSAAQADDAIAAEVAADANASADRIDTAVASLKALEPAPVEPPADPAV
jgi:hypothetical protein